MALFELRDLCLEKLVTFVVYACLQVDYVEPSQNIVHLKMIPRVDYSQPRGIMRTSSSQVAV